MPLKAEGDQGTKKHQITGNYYTSFASKQGNYQSAFVLVLHVVSKVSIHR